MNLNESINHFLPKIKLISPKNEIDYYGFSYYLNKKLGFKKYNYSFSSWVHGWIFHELKFIEKFNTSQYYPHLKIVANQSQKEFVKSHGFSNVITAGYPYLYIEKNQKIKKFKNSLLVMPPKNSMDTLSRWNEDEFIDQIISYRKSFDTIIFCIDQVSFNNKIWIDKIIKNNFQFVIGADSRDANSLLRMKIIFQHFDFVHSPVIGSAIAYAANEGCKVSISDNYLEYNLSGYTNHPLYKINKPYIEYEIYTNSKEYVKNNFGFLFKEPSKALILNDWAKKELGFEFKKDIHALPSLLGWRMIDKFKFFPMKYANSIANRLGKHN